jgi:threonine dehydrogenase-like Zn-dependent dehydrogenase
MATMRAAFFESFQTLTVRDANMPEPGRGEVRVRVRYCGICGSDLTVFKTGALSGPGVVLGHEVSAVVDLDPAGQWTEGARVAVYPEGRGCGECVWCRAGRPRYCAMPPQDYRFGGGYAQYAVVPAHTLLAVPADVEDRAASMAEPLGVALRAVERAGVRPGDVAYVQGLGPLGLLCVAALSAAGCRVIGSDPREDRRMLALELGADEVFDPVALDAIRAVVAFDPKGPGVVFECSGAPDALQLAFDVCAPGGVVGVLGLPATPVMLLRMMLRELRAFSIQGPTPDSMRSALRLLQERPSVALVATGLVALDGTPEAFRSLIDGATGAKVLVDPWAPTSGFGKDSTLGGVSG